MQLTFLGTGSAMPTGERMQTGLLVEDGEDRLLVDCGSGVLHTLARSEVGYEGVDTVLLSHHHLDHVSDLLPLLKARWLAGEETLTVVGPDGTEALVEDLLDVHEYLRDRVDLTLREVDVGSFDVAGFDVDAIETEHSMPGLAYRFDGGEDGDLVFSADTEAFEGMAEFADGASVLVHDCSFPDSVDVSNHPTPTQLGASLDGVEIPDLYLTHLYPHTDGEHDAMTEAVREAGFDGEVHVARDGLGVDV
ncbi:MBL fold metallo-hydrolase [Halobacterium jilantaiense]|uniref:Ribonuclease BN, tRNA processing enzyme n=1 Tax=Halobacterium jilantaiense TaxID=355548 RepID=A0A1I0QQW1_9EURY|nr:MBL fold metallo-hydrolase [Halobacterium jilantaiense]SEW29921.1 Ribonuclease BN, tRNA processing enzyme [Halobacterium jilantaiense]